MDEKKVKAISQKYKTPMYLLDGDKLEDTYQKMKKALPGFFEIFYSVKANPMFGICKILKKNSSGIEVASAGELYLALEAGFEPENILFTGPGKTASELVCAMDNKIAAINTESFQEIVLIDELACKNNQIVDIGIRIHPNFSKTSKNPIISMMGSGTQFGIDIDEIPQVMEFVKSSPYINLVCLHVYSGSQIFEPDTTIAYFEQTLAMFKEIIVNYKLDIKILDFGGGFGVSYDGKHGDYDFYYLASEIKKICEQNKDFINGKRIILESGRYILAESGVFLTEVLYRKVLNGNTFLITDAGMNQNALSTFREKKIRGNFKMHVLDNKGETEVVTVAGPLCTPDDILGRNVTLNKADRGDILCIPNMGAYGSSFSPVHFLGHPAPCEVLLYKDIEYCLKKHGDYNDILMGQERICL